jgi:2-phosphoglycerate kinase
MPEGGTDSTSSAAEDLDSARTPADLLDVLAALSRSGDRPGPDVQAAYRKALSRLRAEAAAPWAGAEGCFPEIPAREAAGLAALALDLRTRDSATGEVRSTLESPLSPEGCIYDYVGLGLHEPDLNLLSRALTEVADGAAPSTCTEAAARLGPAGLARLLDRHMGILFATRRSLLLRNRIPNALATRLAVLPANDYDTARQRVMPVVRGALRDEVLEPNLRDLLAAELGAALARLAIDHHHAVKPEVDRIFGSIRTFEELQKALNRLLDGLGQTEGPGVRILYQDTVRNWQREIKALAVEMNRRHLDWQARFEAEAQALASEPLVREHEIEPKDAHTLVRQLAPRLYPEMPRLVDLRKPLIVLVGGATGTGKSSVARILSDHLGVHAYFSTDVLRQIQRAVTRPETHPALHRSSFAARPLLRGFMEQSLRISEAVEAVIRRLAEQGVSAVIEGVSLIPGFLPEDAYDLANIKHLVVVVGSPDNHMTRFRSRGQEASGRGEERYLAKLGAIREIQNAFLDLAGRARVRVLDNANLLKTAALSEAWMESPFTDRWRPVTHPDLDLARDRIAQREVEAAPKKEKALVCHEPVDPLLSNLSLAEEKALAILGPGGVRRIAWACLEDLSRTHRSFLDVRDIIFDWTRQLSVMAFSSYDEARRKLKAVLAHESVDSTSLEALFLPRYRRTLTEYIRRDGAEGSVRLGDLDEIEDLDTLGSWIEKSGLAPALVRRYVFWLTKRRETAREEFARLRTLKAGHARLASIERELFASDPVLRPVLGSVDVDAVIGLSRRLLREIRPGTPGAKDLARPTLILLGGAPATSKKAVGRAVKQALAIPTYLRTDVIRQTMRRHLDSKHWPDLHASSLTLPPAGERAFHAEYFKLFNRPQDLIAFKDQWRTKVLNRFFFNAGATFLGIQSAMDRLITENQSAVIEGPAVLPGALPARYFRLANVVQVVLLAPDEHEHYRRFIDQGHAREGFLSIRFIHNELRAMARTSGVLTVPGHPVENAAAKVVRTVSSGLCDWPFGLTHGLLCDVLQTLEEKLGESETV